MAKLTTAKRKKLPKSDFGLPDQKKYPMPNKSHAINAKARATQMVKKGKLSPSAKEKIDAKANKIIGKKKDGMSHVSNDRIEAYGKSLKKKKSK